VTRHSARQRLPRTRATLRREVASRADVLQLLRLLALASPELAGFAFMCDGGVETNSLESEPVAGADACRDSESSAHRAESRGEALCRLPSAEAHIVRLPLVPTQQLERKRWALSHRVRSLASSVVSSIRRGTSGP